MNIRNKNMMPSFRIGRAKVWDASGKVYFQPANEAYHDAWFERFDRYWLTREGAQRWLEDEILKKVQTAACEGELYVKATDPALGERIAKHEVEQADFKLPYYDKVCDMVYAMERWAIARDFEVGEWEEPPVVRRLNTTLGDTRSEAAREKVVELEQKLAYFGRCRIEWSCMGWARSVWQSEADAAWIAENRPDWKATISDTRTSVTVTLRNRKEVTR